MRAGHTHRLGPARRCAAERRVDAGFTMVEVVVSTTLIGIMMAALTTFFVASLSVTSRQSGAQSAVQLADDAAEQVRALTGSAIATGRDRASSDAQWASPVAGVRPYLADMQETWDAAASSGSGPAAVLPTVPRSVLVGGAAYGQNWYLGTCWQPPTGGPCASAQVLGYVPFFRVVVAVTWSERHCPNATCSYLTSTLVSTGRVEPVFNPNQNAPAPAVTNPGATIGEVSVPVTLQLAAAGGAAPVTWAGAGLPPGLTISSSGLVAGAPSTPGRYPVTVSATDGFRLVGTAAFGWTVNALPVPTPPGNQTTAVGTAVVLPILLTGGTAPLTWSAAAPGPGTGLPAGLAISSATGAIAGKPTTAGPAKTVKITVIDSFGRSGSITFRWTVR